MLRIYIRHLYKRIGNRSLNLYRYIGNKTKVLAKLLPIITKDATPGAKFADLMCGTASVSAALKNANYSVIASDNLTFSKQHAEVRLLINRTPSFRKIGMPYLDILAYLNNLSPINDFFFREYSPSGRPANGTKPRKYLSEENATKLDAINETINAWTESSLLSTRENSLLRHNLVLAVNRVANIAGTYGHYRSNFSKSSLGPLQMRPIEFQTSDSLKHQVFQGRAEEIAKRISCDVLYLDPPYKKRQYAANYHLIETVALGDKPNPVGVSGLRDWWPQYSDFCSKRRIESAFDSILGVAKYSQAFISYSEDGLLPTEEVFRILRKYGKVDLHKFQHIRFKSNESALLPNLEEYVFELTPE